MIYENNEWGLRLARPEDNQRLCHILGEVKMDADLRIAEERDPDFFALRKLHGGTAYTIVLIDKAPGIPESDRVSGCCTVVVRDGWLSGRLARVGYLCDLRVIAKFRQGRVFPNSIGLVTDYIMKVDPVDAFYFSMMRDNRSAQHASRLANATRLTPYQMVNVQLLGKYKSGNARVLRASESDIPELSRFLEEENALKQFGFRFDESLVRNRLARWPDFSLENFYFIRDAQGKIVACAAPWNPEGSLRRSRVHGYGGSMKLLKKAYNLEVALRGGVPLPEEGGCFHILSLSHVAIRNHDPALLRALIEQISYDWHTRRIHFVSVLIPETSPLERAFGGLRIQKVAMDIYGFPGNRQEYAGGLTPSVNPGFEMVLH